jgi:hypothetical protein
VLAQQRPESPVNIQLRCRKLSTYILDRLLFNARLVVGINLSGRLPLVGVLALFLGEFLKECERRPNTALEFFEGE